MSAAAEQRLGLVAGLAVVEQKSVPARRLLGGDVVALPGHAAWAIAASAGTVQSLPGSALPPPGSRVRAGQLLLALSPLFGPTERMQVSSARVDAEAQVARAQVQDEAAELAFTRSERLVADRLAGTRLLDEAKAQRETARATLRAALSQREAMLGTGARSGPLSLVGVEAPMAGVLREVRVAVHQQVVAGTPLFEVVNDERLWVRVPVPSGQWSALLADDADPSRAVALVDSLSAPADSVPVPATPVQPMPLTPPSPQVTGMGMLDRYFALPDSRRFVLGQRVAVWLPLRSESPSVVLPAAALLRDPSGAAWVYERSAPQVFSRRRVEVIRIDSGLAMLSLRSLTPTGLHLGSMVVTAGAMELYGAEFGAGK